VKTLEKGKHAEVANVLITTPWLHPPPK
jgi:hypothetical protein